jgi:hypothetical protein
MTHHFLVVHPGHLECLPALVLEQIRECRSPADLSDSSGEAVPSLRLEWFARDSAETHAIHPRIINRI